MSDNLVPCAICKAPTEYEAHDIALCHRCATITLEHVQRADFRDAFINAKILIQRIISAKTA